MSWVIVEVPFDGLGTVRVIGTFGTKKAAQDYGRTRHLKFVAHEIQKREPRKKADQ